MATGITTIDKFFRSLGNVNSGSPVTVTVPGTGNNYLLFTANNNADSVTLWFIRPNTSVAIQLAGGNQISITMGSSRTMTVTSATRNVAAFLAEI